MEMKKYVEYAKMHLVDGILFTMLTTILLRDCGAQNLITDKVLPKIDSISNKITGAKYMKTSKDKTKGHSISDYIDYIFTLPHGHYIFEDGNFIHFGN